MATDTGSPIANRDEAIPVVRIPSNEDEADHSDSHGAESEEEQQDRKRDRLKGQANKIKDKWETYSGGPQGRQTLQDKLLSSLISQIIPSEGLGDEEDSTDAPRKKERRSKKYVNRPEFGPRLMTYNFRRFNARIGVVFVLQNRLIRLFSWKQPTATLSFLAVYSLLCLRPHLLPLIPLVLVLFSIMIPSFLARHPTPTNDPRLAPSFHGPPTAAASRVKPAPEFSTDFWRNMRDLQNSMEDFSRLHDAANEYITPYTNFSNEALSSTLFLALSTLSILAFTGSHLLPWRFIALFTGWSLISLCHPKIQTLLLSSRNLSQLSQHISLAQSTLRSWIASDILLASPPSIRQVEIFELQKHHPASDTWESWLFSPTPYDPLSQTRIAGHRPKGTQFFEDVQTPIGWEWKEKKWNLDLGSREWVEERMISGVEIETEGERWVYDLPEEEVSTQMSPGKGRKVGGGVGRVKSAPKSGWEESNGMGGNRRGEWRRRRWMRLVEKRASDDVAKGKERVLASPA